MSNSTIIRGYALPFNSVGEVDGSYEKFAPGALLGMFPLSAPIDVRWFNHSESAARLAGTKNGTLSLFVDEYGLGFEAKLDIGDPANLYRLREITRRQDPMAFASIGGLVIKSYRLERYCYGAATCKVITSATFGHIAVTDRSAAYHATAVWPDVPLDAAPWKIRDLAARWRTGRARWQDPRPATKARPDDRRAIGRTVSGNFVMMSTTTGRLSLLRAARAKSEVRK